MASEVLIRYVEAYELKKAAEHFSKVDAVVVLSGSLTETKSTEAGNPEWGDPDRFFAGIELLKLNKARYLIFTGGMPVWGRKSYNEGLILSARASGFGINGEKILVTGEAKNTEQEAIEVKKVLIKYKLNSIILVTSAYHMQRAKIIFRNHNIENISYYPVDFQSGTFGNPVIDLIPNAGSFSKSNDAIREILGFQYYKLKRYLRIKFPFYFVEKDSIAPKQLPEAFLAAIR